MKHLIHSIILLFMEKTVNIIPKGMTVLDDDLNRWPIGTRHAWHSLSGFASRKTDAKGNQGLVLSTGRENPFASYFRGMILDVSLNFLYSVALTTGSLFLVSQASVLMSDAR